MDFLYKVWDNLREPLGKLLKQKYKKEQLTISNIFLIFLKLGCISFGGPIAHLGYFRDEFVGRLKWLSDHAYADLVALCQFLPGPASSQVGIALGLSKGGVGGAIAAWLGFTLPSALLMVIFGIALIKMGIHDNPPWIHGLKVTAVAVVAQALWGMSVSLCSDKTRVSLAVLACIGSSIIPYTSGQIAMIVLGGLFGLFFLSPEKSPPISELKVNLSRRTGIIVLLIFLFCSLCYRFCLFILQTILCNYLNPFIGLVLWFLAADM